MDLSKNIREIREKLKIKQIEMANALGIDPPNYARLEKRGNKLSFEQLQKISEVFGMSVVEIIEYPNSLQEKKNELSTKEKNEYLVKINDLQEKINEKDKVINYLLYKSTDFSTLYKARKVFDDIHKNYTNYETVLPLKKEMKEFLATINMQEGEMTEREWITFVEISSRLQVEVFDIILQKVPEFKLFYDYPFLFNINKDSQSFDDLRIALSYAQNPQGNINNIKSHFRKIEEESGDN